MADSSLFAGAKEHSNGNSTSNEDSGVTETSRPAVLGASVQVGDHVYQWRSFMGIPGVFQHHGIVMDVQRRMCPIGDNVFPDECDENLVLTIADFSNVDQAKNPKRHRPSSVLLPPTEGNAPESDKMDGSGEIQPDDLERTPWGFTQKGIFRVYTDTDKWHKVDYESKFWKRSWSRSGTCTAASSDPVGKVLARVHFIVQNPQVLPDYHVVNANCECVAVWCKTGQWMTLQASSVLGSTLAGNIKSSATLSASAAASTVSVQVPAHGVMGWFGYTTTTQVSWLSLHPLVIPALAGYAVVTVGTPAAMYLVAHKQWKRTTERLESIFWEKALEDPQAFAECMYHWSDRAMPDGF
eukprot:Nitzschia sp. Nitz4//scaffold331_size19140//4239//5297//NITZ4_008732-RA/size19140-processed-gene-0.32-mRNA-1//1//CDS//3329548176//5025//frame0